MKKIIVFISILLISSSLFSQKIILIDYDTETGVIKDMFGGNKGGEDEKAKPFLDEIGIKDIRIHDYHKDGGDYYFYSDFWNKNTDGSFIDINTSFDPANMSHYHWQKTDNIVEKIINNNFSVYFRIGTSFPNPQYILQPQYPPSNTGGTSTDFSKFAQLATNTVKHYNNGWNNGFHYNIEYWEIWNEPGGLFWKGNPVQFRKMYKAVSTAIKKDNPDVKVGALGAVFTTTLGINTVYREGFIEYCHNENLALDFYSWHAYNVSNPYGIKQLSTTIRNILDSNGFANTESHITEINSELGDGLQALINSPQGAAYYLSLMLTAQESDIDKMLIYPANCLITEHRNGPFTLTKSAYGMKAFTLLKNNTPIIVQSSGNEVITDDLDDETLNFMTLAAKDANNEKLYIIVSNFVSTNSEYQINITNLPWSGTHATRVVKNIITETDNFTETTSILPQGITTVNINNMTSPSVLLLRLEADKTSSIEQSENFKISVYPNPNSGKFTIMGDNIKEIAVMTIDGKIIKQINVNQLKYDLDISEQPNASYFIKIVTKNKTFIEKVIVR